MNDKIEQSIQVLNEQIASSNLNEVTKKHLYEIIKGIITSINNRVYSVKEDNHTSYITLKSNPNNKNPLLEICIVDKTIDSTTSKSANKHTFPSMIELINYFETHTEEITNSLNNIAYIHTRKKELDEEKAIDKSFADKQPKITDTIKEKIENMFIPEDLKECINGILSTLVEESSEILSAKDETFEEYISIQDNSIKIIRKIHDLTGQVVGESAYIILPDELISYIEEHKTTLEESLNKKMRF